ncbi:hypothetical protein P280DRAFT_325091 [Massarina eburnea CBS 473.64]|uniref:Uncharacterized protein n=1 Tax=Massarina eburnea CBS 473.64 TaxID=1395130 RepID=A0A6A6S0H9_9PLEO|nr:hypothetical protein P280DRAFT_325091 [Massarina eburnea CBS 473.64]
MKSLSLLLASAASVQAQLFLDNLPAPVEDLAPLPTLFKRNTYQEPCQEVSASWAAAAPKATAAVAVPADVAYKCLQSVPVDKDGDLKQIQELKQMLQFQSTLSYLKQGLKDDIEPVDLMASLDEMTKKLNEGGFKSEYDFQVGIKYLFSSTGDFHLRWNSDILEPLIFGRLGGELTLLSKDGVAFPEIYLVSDIYARKFGNISESEISPIKTINGQEATSYLQNISTGAKYHNPDARYNYIFRNQATVGAKVSSSSPWLVGGLYDGPSTELEFNNGTKTTLQNLASIPTSFDFTGVIDGKSFFEVFCTGVSSTIRSTSRAIASATKLSTATVTKRDVSSSSTSSSTLAKANSTATATRSSATATSTSTLSLLNYPKPEFASDSLTFSGYYLSDTGYDDVAVLAIPDFAPKVGQDKTAGINQAQKLLRAFFAETIEKKKNRLLIDLRGNGGGTIDMGFELFKQLFPTVEPYGGTRYRAHDAMKILSAQLAAIDANATMKALNKDIYEKAEYSEFVWGNIVNENYTAFKSFDDYYGPYTIDNDTFTAIRRYNFSNHVGGHTYSSLFNLTGYAPQPTPAQPFKAENILVMQDGLCGSTCAVFAELMREQAKVHSIFVGGRPQAGPAQGVGGSKGAQVLTMDTIKYYMDAALNVTLGFYGAEAANYMNRTAVGAISHTTQLIKRSAHHTSETINGGVNTLNNYRKGDKTNTPLQFIYEAADCRIFSTYADFGSPVLLWKRAVEAKWGDGKCAEGSQGDKTAISVVDGKAFNKQPESLPKKVETSSNAAEANAKVSGMMVAMVVAVMAATLL